MLFAGRSRRRCLLRYLAAAALATVSVLVPVESADLPSGPDGLAGSVPVLAQGAVPVQAQGAVVDGVPNDCPATPVQWYPALAGSVCQLDMEPCPTTPVSGLGTSVVGHPHVLRFSVGYPDTDGLTLLEYPGFCELRILEVNDAAAYANCLGLTGYAVVDEDVDRVVGGVTETVALCRLLHAAKCPAGVRVDTDICRAIQRRTWTCQDEDGYRPMNEYNRCYKPPQPFTGTVHDACGEGAPTFVAQPCADYVGGDYHPSPALVDCAVAYPTGDATTALRRNTAAGTSSDYWCEFNAAHTRTVCHGTNPPASECAPSTAMCLKRSTRTGGCDAIAKTIRCRALEADYHDGDLTEVEVRLAGCQPCLVLPFSPLPPACPDDLTADTQLTTRLSLFYLIEIEEDLNTGTSICNRRSRRFDLAACLELPTCEDPARGSLAWSSTHFSQVAVVNAPVIVSVRDASAELRRAGVYFSGRWLRSRWDTLPYPVSPAGNFGYSMARFGTLGPGATGVGSVGDYVAATGECLFVEPPQFQLKITELWPDSPADLADIEALIGSDALDWWNDLDLDEREARTRQRGLEWWPDLSQADRDARVAGLTEVLNCNFSLPVWCRWTPSGTGYFKISGVAVWRATRWDTAGRLTMPAYQARRINNALQDQATRDGVRRQLSGWRLTPEEVGLTDALDAVLPLDGLAEARYSGIESRFGCAGTDIRVYCPTYSYSSAANYTETDPIGIEVHEVRVATRAPNS